MHTDISSIDNEYIKIVYKNKKNYCILCNYITIYFNINNGQLGLE